MASETSIDKELIAQLKQQLSRRRGALRDRTSQCRGYKDKVQKLQESLTVYLESVRVDLNETIDSAVEEETRREQDDGAPEESSTSSGDVPDTPEVRRQAIEAKRSELLEDLQRVSNATHSKLDELLGEASADLKTLEEAPDVMSKLVKDKEELVNTGQQLIDSLDKVLEKTLRDDALERILRTVKSVQFVKGLAGETYNGRIGGYDGKWKLRKNIKIPDEVREPIVVGCIGEDIVLTDWEENDTFVTDIDSELTTRVIASDDISIVSCQRLDGATIVCGKYRGDASEENVSGSITLCSRHWKFIKDITIPKKDVYGDTLVNVAVDKDGRIVAAQHGQTDIYVINPSSGDIVNSIKAGKDDIVLRGVLSTGKILAQPFIANRKLFLIDGSSGARSEITHHKDVLNCGIDQLTDDLFPVYWDPSKKTYMIDQTTGAGKMKSRQMLPYPLTRTSGMILDEKLFLRTSRVVMTPSGKLVVCNRKEVHVYEKIFHL